MYDANDIKKLHAAAKIIIANGVEGIEKSVRGASHIVGRDTALAMTILFLNLNAGTKVNKLLEKNGLLEVIDYSPTLGRGVVYNKSGEPIYVIELEKMYKPEPVQGVHLGMFIQGPGDYQVIPAGNFPFREAYNEMLKAKKRVRKEVKKICPKDD